MNILIAGDFCQKNRVDTAVKGHRFNEIFGEIRTLIQTSDYSIVNFEFPITINSTSALPISKCGPNLHGTKDAIDAIKYAGFDCCTLANNHIMDQGSQSCIDTKDELRKAGIDTVGAGKNIDEAKQTIYKKIQKETLAIINCCEHEFSIATVTTAGANPLDPIQQFYAIREARGKADYVLVIVHGGHEMHQLPSPRMQEFYRFFIEAGADAVVNHHQHCFSGYEIYNGKPIFYGLGNLCFDRPKNWSTIWNDGYMVTLMFSKKEAPSFALHPYIQCTEQIGVHLLQETSRINERIKELNNIISNPEKLKAMTDEYYKHSTNIIKKMFSPYRSRLSQKLLSLHLLPEVTNKKQLLQILNYANCESHRDKLIVALNEIIKTL